MAFFRPEALRLLRHWRDPAIGVAAAAFGLNWATRDSGARALIGAALAVGGTLFALAALQRARFRRGGEGPGIVQVTEGQIAYFGPHGGGVAARDDLTRLACDKSGPTWILGHAGGPPLAIPLDAAGADALFDVFATLPGLDLGRLLQVQRSPESTVIWEAPRQRLH